MSKRQQAELQMLTVMHEQGLLEAGWKFEWMRGNSRWGMCDDSKKTLYLSSDHVENDPSSEVLDTILHEVAHALHPTYQGSNGRWVHHGPEWRRTFILLGGSGDVRGPNNATLEQMRADDDGTPLPIAAKLAGESHV